MERLTKYPDEVPTEVLLNFDFAIEMYGKLSELEDAEEQGRLVVLPCRIGDVIFSLCWDIKNEKYQVCTSKVKNVRYDSVDGAILVSDGERYRVWGKAVFLTRKEAETALKSHS